MTTVPNPLSVKARSTGRRRRPAPDRGPASCARCDERLTQLTQTLSRSGRDVEDRSPFEERAPDQLPNLDLSQGLHLAVRHVALRQDDESAGHTEQAADVEVLPRLGHDGLVGRDDEGHGVEAVDAGKHVADEPLVTGNVDEGSDEICRQRHVGKAQVDRYAPPLLLGEAVGIGPGERPDESALAMVDVAGRSDDEGAHERSPRDSSSRGVCRAEVRP